MSFFRQVARKQTTRWRDGSWQQVPAERVHQGSGIQTLKTYVDRQQEIVAEWVSNRPIFDAWVRDTGYEGGGRLWVAWWR